MGHDYSGGLLRTRREEAARPRVQQPDSRSSSSTEEVLRLQRLAGNRAVSRSVAGGTGPLAMQRDGGTVEGATGTAVATEEEAAEGPIDHLDDFLADRVALFRVDIVGERFFATLERAPNAWCEQYTPRALVLAAFAGVVRQLTVEPPSASHIEAMREQIVHSLDAPASLGPAAVQPRFFARIERGPTAQMIGLLGLELNARGRELMAATERGAYVVERLIEVAQNFGSLQPLLAEHEELSAAGLGPQHVLTMLTEPSSRSVAAHLAMSHEVVQTLDPARDQTWRALGVEQWVAVLAPIAVRIVEAAGRAALERAERERRHALNEALRAHRLESPEDSVRYLLQTYDPESSVTVNFLGPVEIRGGQTIVNAQGQRLFILRAGSTVIYQNQDDHLFYAQSAAGVQEELRWGVFAMVAEQTRHIIPMTKFALDVTAAIFPPARLPYLALNVLNAAGGLAQNRAELERLAQNLQISIRAVEALLPGLLGVTVWSTAASGLAALFSGGYTTVAPKQVLLLFLRVASAAVRGGAGARLVGEMAKSAWAEVRKELLSLGGIIAQAQVLLVRQLADRDSWEEHPVELLRRELGRFLGAEGGRYAQLLLAMEPQQLDRLTREMQELAINGTGLVNLLADSLS